MVASICIDMESIIEDQDINIRRLEKRKSIVKIIVCTTKKFFFEEDKGNLKITDSSITINKVKGYIISESMADKKTKKRHTVLAMSSSRL